MAGRITYIHLPHKNVSVLFRRLLGHGGAALLARTDGLVTFASGTSVHRQILPDATLSLGFSATAMHWLSTGPGAIADHGQAVGATEAERGTGAALPKPARSQNPNTEPARCSSSTAASTGSGRPSTSQPPPVPGGVRLDQTSTRVTACPYATAFRSHRDPAAFARAYVPTLRSRTESTFASALDPSRARDER